VGFLLLDANGTILLVTAATVAAPPNPKDTTNFLRLELTLVLMAFLRFIF